MAYIGTNVALSADEEYVSPTVLSDRADHISGSVSSDQDGTIYIEQSGDGENWDISTSYDLTADDGKGFSESLLLPFIRIRYVNGGTDQTDFRLFARYTSAGDS